MCDIILKKTKDRGGIVNRMSAYAYSLKVL